ncbi:MAG TPA: HNH endonuclease signature motif containing protein [Blastocatellia bacterium]|nr:HNH endonuclease signature motif containing protein [Blastocatellia bacterium]
MSSVPDALRRALRVESREPRCAYCQSPEKLLGIPLEANHIIPEAEGGRTELANLCLCCRACNGYKWKRATGRDPKTNRIVRLFHPRKQKWSKHFAWSDDGTIIVGLTAIGRATVDALQMNNELITSLRRLWVILDLHPPKDS